MSGVSPSECHLVVQKRNETVIGDGNAMRVGAEVTKHLLGSAERRFAVDYPAEPVKLTDQTPEQPGLSQATQQAVELELSGSMSLLERFQKLAAENFTENPLC